MRAALLALLLSACATDRELAMAYVEEGFVVKPIVRVYVDNPDAVCRTQVVRHVRFADGTRINACADPYSKIDPRVCTIILPHNAPAWLDEHEVLHCERGSYHK